MVEQCVLFIYFLNVILNGWFINIFESSDIINFSKLNIHWVIILANLKETFFKYKNNTQNSYNVCSNNQTSNVDNIWQDGLFFKNNL
jgi:hypothetical protein